MKRVILSETHPQYKVTFINRYSDKGVKRCATIDQVISLLKPYVHPKQSFIIDRMIESDKLTQHGSIADTSAFRVYKGEHQMTDYTSY